jgi:outer membrane protein TolC
VHVAERRLRYLINMPQNTGELLRPADEPIEAPIVFDWSQALSEALQRRPELRRQKWMIEQRELQLVAARNLLKPDLDVVGLYRWRGFGKSLLDPEGGGPPFDDAFTTLANGDFQEWQLGAELNFPIGNRRAHAGVRNAEFQLVREQALLREQEQRIVHDLSDAYGDVGRAFGLLQTVYNRREAARDQVSSLQTAFEANYAPLNLLLDAQRRLALAESRYFEALVEYTLAIKNMHFEKGNLLEYEGIQLAEGPWSEPAHVDAADRLERRLPARYGPFMPDQQVIVEPGA